MESYVLDVILIALAVIVLLHLFYKNNTVDKETLRETMAVIDTLKKDLTETKNEQESLREEESQKVQILPENPIKNYNDGIYRDEGTMGLDRTDKSMKWYHYTNRLVDEV